MKRQTLKKDNYEKEVYEEKKTALNRKKLKTDKFAKRRM